MTLSLDGARVVVVGASAGIGRALAEHAAAQGARVVVSARRADKLRELAGCHAVPADISDQEACRRLVDEAVAHLGGSIDVLVHSAGVGTLAPIEKADAASWVRDYTVNVVGPTCITAAALPHLSEHAVVSFLSSESTAETRWGMSAYASSKAALDATIRAWRTEHPERRFQRIVMGATMPTDFGVNFDGETLGIAFERWTAGGISMTAMETDDVGRHLSELLAVFLAHPQIDVPDLTYDPRGEPWH